MPILRKVFGPFHPELVNSISQPEIRWYFNGIRDDKTTAHWVLIYDIRKRTFKASNIPINDGLIGRSRRAVQHLPKAGVDETVNPDAWLDEAPVMEGTITSILKSKLPPEEIARATALAITQR